MPDLPRRLPLAGDAVHQVIQIAIDERAGAYFALGLAKASRRPVAVLTTSGTAAANCAINLHVFADSLEAVACTLQQNDVPYRLYEARLKSRRDQTETFAGLRFTHQDAAVEATVFPLVGVRQAPISPIDGKPMKRADARTVRGLLDEARP